MLQTALTDSQKNVVRRYVEVWRRWRSGIRGFADLERDLENGSETLVDGIRVDNIYDYTFALRSRKPGQQVRITIKRDGAERELVATLGRRP